MERLDNASNDVGHLDRPALFGFLIERLDIFVGSAGEQAVFRPLGCHSCSPSLEWNAKDDNVLRLVDRTQLEELQERSHDDESEGTIWTVGERMALEALFSSKHSVWQSGFRFDVGSSARPADGS